MKKRKNIIIFLVSIVLLVAISLIVFWAYKLTNLNTNEIENINNVDVSKQNNIKQINETQNTKTNSLESTIINENEEIKISLNINNKKIGATLNNNKTVKQLVQKFPMTIQMNDLHSNEKYNYLDFNLPTNTNTPNKINAGDIKLYGDNCLVIFYKTFDNSYNYTNLGKVDNVNSFVSELNDENLTITFELVN